MEYNMRVILNLEDIMAHYTTEQKKILFTFLSNNKEKSYSVEELNGELVAAYGDRAPGKSTLYRLITGLVEEGKVRRFVRGHGRQFAYQIVDCENCHSHLHLKCVGCGKLIHLDHETSDQLIEKVQNASCFSVMETETVLFGECSECNNSKNRI